LPSVEHAVPFDAASGQSFGFRGGWHVHFIPDCWRYVGTAPPQYGVLAQVHTPCGYEHADGTSVAPTSPQNAPSGTSVKTRGHLILAGNALAQSGVGVVVLQESTVGGRDEWLGVAVEFAVAVGFAVAVAVAVGFALAVAVADGPDVAGVELDEPAAAFCRAGGAWPSSGVVPGWGDAVSG
jgi:hypothetical protein